MPAEPMPVAPHVLFDAYLRRLGQTCRPTPDLRALTDLMARHLEQVPFENLDVIAGTPRPLDTDTMLEKVVAEARGGFCYELNEAFRALLEHLGFDVRRIEARVWQPAVQQFGAPFDHLALVVQLAGAEFLVDVGYGDGIRAPLRLPDSEAVHLSGTYRLSPVRAGILQLASRTQPLYEMTVTDQPLAAFVPMCRFHQTSAESIFSKGLICTRATATGRITLSGRRRIVTESGNRTESAITDLATVLRDDFGIDAGPALLAAAAAARPTPLVAY